MNTQLKNAARENLKELLISNGVLDYFVKEVRENYPVETKCKRVKGVLEFQLELPRSPISTAFSWDYAPQGFDFWCQLSLQWANIYNQLEKKYENV